MSDAENLNHGHRARVKNKFVSSQDSFLDYELLELLLFYSIPRRDVKLLAKDLINQFGSLKNILTSDITTLQKIKGISTNTAILLNLSHTLCKIILRKNLENSPIISNWEQLIDYCYAKLAFVSKEQIYIVYLNSKSIIIKDEILITGSINYAEINIRNIIERSLSIGASSIILIHNHPSGNYEPSKEDIELTQELFEVAKPLDLILFDHLIISKKGFFSFRDAGLI